MRIAASNIAWAAEEDEAVAAMMARLGYEGVEVAPTRLWPSPLAVSADEIARVRRWWESRRLPVVAMQALLFGRPDLAVFGEEAKREETLRYLEAMVRLAAGLGARVMVFGSPRNRLAAGRAADEVAALARSFFGRIGAYAAARGVAFCIEPNPPQYGCDWVTDADQGLAVVEDVASPGFGLHLDAGGMTLAGGDVAGALSRTAPRARHFHVSEAQLAPIGSGTVDHALFARGLSRAGYAGWLSVEMRAPEGADRLGRIETSLARAVEAYRGVAGAPRG